MEEIYRLLQEQYPIRFGDLPFEQFKEAVQDKDMRAALFSSLKKRMPEVFRDMNAKQFDKTLTNREAEREFRKRRRVGEARTREEQKLPITPTLELEKQRIFEERKAQAESTIPKRGEERLEHAREPVGAIERPVEESPQEITATVTETLNKLNTPEAVTALANQSAGVAEQVAQGAEQVAAGEPPTAWQYLPEATKAAMLGVLGVNLGELAYSIARKPETIKLPRVTAPKVKPGRVDYGEQIRAARDAAATTARDIRSMGVTRGGIMSNLIATMGARRRQEAGIREAEAVTNVQLAERARAMNASAQLQAAMANQRAGIAESMYGAQEKAAKRADILQSVRNLAQTGLGTAGMLAGAKQQVDMISVMGSVYGGPEWVEREDGRGKYVRYAADPRWLEMAAQRGATGSMIGQRTPQQAAAQQPAAQQYTPYFEREQYPTNVAQKYGYLWNQPIGGYFLK